MVEVGNDTDDEGDKLFKSRNGIHSVSNIFAALFLGFLMALYGIVYTVGNSLPKPYFISDEVHNPDVFIAERAMHYLKLLTDIGPRVVGSYENEFLSVDFLNREITLIQQQAHSSQEIQLDVQTVTGSYYLAFKPFGVINAYANVQNVVVRLSSRNGSEHSLLINAHYDSVPTSPGGSDDGINCAVMLEILRKMSRLPYRPEHNIIFLFNGAEETPLQASHGFITQHKWASEVRVVINLEAAGAGGKAVLFQTGPGASWLMKYYNKVPHPCGQVAGEELFQSNIIPSDTDFRIFRDFGKVVGYDMAFVKNGYRYHTKNDDFSNIPIGSYQHVGDNTLSLIRNLANATELLNLKGLPEGKNVFFDVLGLFMITYSERTATLLNIFVSLASTILAIKSFYEFGLRFSLSSLKCISYNIGFTVLGWVFAAILVIATAVFVDTFSYTMSWYDTPWLLIGLYVAPVVGCILSSLVLINYLTDMNNLGIAVQAQIQAHTVRLLWTFVLILGTLLGIRSVYAILIPVMFSTVAFAVVHISKMQYSVRQWQTVYILFTITPTILLMYQTEIILSFFVPLCGRIGSDKNPEMIIGIVVLLFTILITCFYAPLITVVRKPSHLIMGLFAIFFMTVIIVSTPLGFPYSSNSYSPRPQRYWIFVGLIANGMFTFLSIFLNSQHTGRVFHNEIGEIRKRDAGFFLLNLDRNSPSAVRKHVKDLNTEKPLTIDCAEELNCGLPVASARMFGILNKSTWIPAEQPVIREAIELKLISKVKISSTLIRYNFTASGPDHMAIYMSPKTDMKLTRISLVDVVPKDQPSSNGRITYYIVYSWGKTKASLDFQMEIETPTNWNKSAVDIAVSGFYVHDRINLKTQHYQNFLSEFPDWTDVSAFLGYYESWMY